MGLAATESRVGARERVARSGHVWRIRVLALALWLLLIIPLAAILRGNSSWLLPFSRDFIRWLGHPEVAGGFTMPTNLGVGIGILVVSSALGWCIASLILANSEFHGNPAFRIGFAIVLAICIVGYCGMVGLVAGRLERTFLLMFAAVIGLVVAVLLTLNGSIHRTLGVRLKFGRPSPLTVASLGVASTVVAFVALHAALSPVTEWDAVVYHAAAAKLWFLEAPNPALIYGPSVGIEISGNYPPLFPSIGVAVDTVIGNYQDIYLRLASPFILAALLLMVHGYARQRMSSSGAAWAVTLVAGAPIMVLYGTWATGYMLLAALWLCVVVLCDVAGTTSKLKSWAYAGGLAGLAILTHFYGLPVLAVGLLALLLGRPSRRNFIGAAVFLCTALLVASPWLIRNILLLHDPLFPVPLPFFHPIGLAEPLWSATQAEIRNNALGQWPGTGWVLLGQQLMTALADRHLLAVGVLFGIAVAAWQALRADRWSLYLLAIIAVLLGSILAPGWFWLRVLILTVPFAALLTARGIVLLDRGELALRPRRWPVWKAAMGASQLAIFAISSVVGVSLAIAGPNQESWTTLLDTSQHDLMAPVRTLGSDSLALYNVYRGDYLSWSWLNANLRDGRRVATLDNRQYYFDRPQDIFYLDGSEAGPLLNFNRPDVAKAFLASHGVSFVLIPGWAASTGPARHPAMDLLPLIGMLGDQNFPIAAAFVGTYPEPTLIYAVGQYVAPVQAGIFPGVKAGIQSSSTKTFVLGEGDTSPRVVVPALNGSPTLLTFEYLLRRPGTLIVNRWDPSRALWVYGVFHSVAPVGLWQRVQLTLPVTSGYVLFGLYASGGDVEVQNFTVSRSMSPIVSVGRGSNQADGSYTLAGKDVLNRIMVPGVIDEPTILSLQYRAHGTGYFDLNYHDVATGGWRTIATSPTADKGDWLTFASPLPNQFVSGPFSEYAVFDNGPNLDIRDVTVSGGLMVVSPIAREPGSDYVIPKGGEGWRILIPMRDGRAAVVTVRFVDTAGSFGLNLLDPANGPRWQFGPVVRRAGRRSLKTVSLSLTPVPARIVQIGPVAYSGALLLRDVSVAAGPVQRYGQAAPRQRSCDSTAHGCQY